MCSGCGDCVLISSHCNNDVTVESTTAWCNDGRYVSVELCTDSSDVLEGGVRSSADNGCQGGEREVQYYGFGVSHGGYDEDSEIGGWGIFGQALSSHTEDWGKKGDYSDILMRSTDK